MNMFGLARQNMKHGFRNYSSLVLSLAFTIMIFFNFQNLIFSDMFIGLGQRNKDYIEILVQALSFVMGCFLFFFIWYATNVFLTRRKKEIGIYVFMGLTNQRIGRLYMLEMTMVGLVTLALGIGFGIITSQLFQMILLAVSDIAVEIGFHFSWQPVLITCGVYLVIYLLFVAKGYYNIVKSSVLDMVSASRRNESVKQNMLLLVLKAFLGTVILISGYFLAVKDGGNEVLANVLAAVVLVVTGIYLIFGGLMPILFQGLAARKVFLYCRERTLWINNVIFHMKKNYRTYAMVCVLMLCSVTVLATSFAVKNRYENMSNFRNTYTFQLLSNQPDLEERARALIEEDNEIAYSSRINILQLDSSLVDTFFPESNYGVVAWSSLEQAAREAGLDFALPQPEDDEVISVEQLHVLSLITDRSNLQVSINGKGYHQLQETTVPYLGYLQENMSFYMVNDAEYERLLPLGVQLYTYNYRIRDIYNYEVSKDKLDVLVSNTEENYTGRVAIDPNDSDREWMKVSYSLCIFLFMVFIMAGGSILFMKLYNDAFEEKERFSVLMKMGVSKRVLRRAVSKQLLATYGGPFLLMTISSYFSVHALEKMMIARLLSVNIVSVAVILAFLVLCYLVSVPVYLKNAGVE